MKKFISNSFGLPFFFFQTAEFQPSTDSITALATIRKNGHHFGTGNIVVPKKFNLPNQQYRGEFNWIYQDVCLINFLLDDYFNNEFTRSTLKRINHDIFIDLIVTIRMILSIKSFKQMGKRA